MSRMSRTQSGLDPLVVVSALQKAIRRANAPLAAWAFSELSESGYRKWAWRRICVTAAEDVAEPLMREIVALREADEREARERRGSPTRVFWSRAIIHLCRARKDRDADHLTNLVLDAGRVSDCEIAELLDTVEAEGIPDLPDYVFDCHTHEGRMRGKTRTAFFKDEFEALTPRQPGLFDHMLEE